MFQSRQLTQGSFFMTRQTDQGGNAGNKGRNAQTYTLAIAAAHCNAPKMLCSGVLTAKDRDLLFVDDKDAVVLRG